MSDTPRSIGDKGLAYIIADLKEQLAQAQANLERERMCHAACGVIAMSNIALRAEREQALDETDRVGNLLDKSIEENQQLKAERDRLRAAKATEQTVDSTWGVQSQTSGRVWTLDLQMINAIISAALAETKLCQ